MKNNVVHVKFAKAKRASAPELACLSYGELEARNTRLQQTQGELKRKLLEQKRLLTLRSKSVEKKEEKIDELHTELTQLKARFKRLHRSFDSSLDCGGDADISRKRDCEDADTSKRARNPDKNQGIMESSLIESLRQKMAPTLAAIMGKSSHAETEDVSAEEKSSWQSFAKPAAKRRATRNCRTWHSIRRTKPLKTGLYLVSDGKHTELSYFNQPKGEFTSKSIQIEYWAEQNSHTA